MKDNKSKILAVTILALFTLTACQNATPGENKAPPAETPTSESAPVVDHGLPSSKGPTAPPTAQKGPSAPPGSGVTINTGAQAVTTNENIRITLPPKTE